MVGVGFCFTASCYGSMTWQYFGWCMLDKEFSEQEVLAYKSFSSYYYVVSVSN